MQMPQELVDQFRQQTGQEPQAIARAMYDRQGRLGETYVAANEATLMLFSRPVDDAPETLGYALTELSEIAVQTGKVFAWLTITSAHGQWKLQFSNWDAPELETISIFWRKQRVEKPVAQEARPIKPPDLASLSATPPLVMFCAAIHAMIGCDDQIDLSELNFLSRRIGEVKAIEEGRRLLADYGVEGVLIGAQKRLNGDQKRCLLANLIMVAMADGLLRSQEQELADRFGVAMDIPQEESERMLSVLLVKGNLTVLIDDENEHREYEEGLTPLVAFCAGVYALTQADGTFHALEKEWLALVIPDAEAIQLGKDYLEGYGLEHFLHRIPAVMNAQQRRCLMANLLDLALADGIIRTGEEQVLQGFQEALQIPSEEYDLLGSQLALKNQLSLFTAA